MALDTKTARKVGDFLRKRLFGANKAPQGESTKLDGEIVLQQQAKAIRELQSLLQRTIAQGEGNSLLVIGPKGSGKTWVLEQALLKVNSQVKYKDNFITVHLNGLIHTDDRLALLEIVRQLDVMEDLGDKITLTFSGLLQYLLQALREGDRSKQSVVVVLDNFDLFTHHKNQMLLYNLFDIAQSRSTPLAVVGLTCRLDAVELLEKRVKSRFSHTQINLFNEHTFEQYVMLFCSLLTLPDKLLERRNQDKWNAHIKELSEDVKMRECLQSVYRFSADVGSLVNLLTVPICRLGLRDNLLRPMDFVLSLRLLEKEAVSAILCGLSVLELCLVIAMKHLRDLCDEELCNFEMVYNEYKKFTQRSHSVEFFGKPVALKAFEHLIALELVCLTDSGGGRGNKGMKEYQSVVLMLGEEQFREALQRYPNCPTDVQRWGHTAGIA